MYMQLRISRFCFSCAGIQVNDNNNITSGRECSISTYQDLLLSVMFSASVLRNDSFLYLSSPFIASLLFYLCLNRFVKYL